MNNNNIFDLMDKAQGMAKACSLAQAIDTTVSELNWALRSNRIEDKTSTLKKMFAQFGNSIFQASKNNNLSQRLIDNRYFEQTDAAVYNQDLVWLRDEIIPNIATRQLCNMMAEKVADDRLRQMGCSPRLLLLLKALFGQ